MVKSVIVTKISCIEFVTTIEKKPKYKCVIKSYFHLVTIHIIIYLQKQRVCCEILLVQYFVHLLLCNISIQNI